MTSIAGASNEQAQGISQINNALAQLDQVTQQNTANAEQSAAASQELAGQARTLQQLLTRFKLQQKNVSQDMGELSPEMMNAFRMFLAQQGYGNALPGGDW